MALGIGHISSLFVARACAFSSCIPELCHASMVLASKYGSIADSLHMNDFFHKVSALA
jgi:hypothetical protein